MMSKSPQSWNGRRDFSEQRSVITAPPCQVEVLFVSFIHRLYHIFKAKVYIFKKAFMQGQLVCCTRPHKLHVQACCAACCDVSVTTLAAPPSSSRPLLTWSIPQLGVLHGVPVHCCMTLLVLNRVVRHF